MLTLASNLDYVVKVHAYSNGRLVAIEEEHNKAIKVQDNTELAYYEMRVRVRKFSRGRSCIPNGLCGIDGSIK